MVIDIIYIHTYFFYGYTICEKRCYGKYVNQRLSLFRNVILSIFWFNVFFLHLSIIDFNPFYVSLLVWEWHMSIKYLFFVTTIYPVLFIGVKIIWWLVCIQPFHTLYVNRIGKHVILWRLILATKWALFLSHKRSLINQMYYRFEDNSLEWSYMQYNIM